MKIGQASKQCKIPKSIKGKRNRKSWRKKCIRRKLGK